MYLRPKRLSKAEKKRKQVEQAADLARTDERAGMQKVQKPPQRPHRGANQRGVSRGNAAIPVALVDLGCVSRTPRACAVADANESICYSFNMPSGCSHAQAGGRCGRGCGPSASRNTQQLETTDPPNWLPHIGSLIANPFHSESTSVSEIASTNSGVGLRSAAEVGVAGGATMIVSQMGLTSARPTVLEVCCGSAG